jgi:hypothetical protein
MRQLGLPLAMVLLGLLGDGRALAQPKICGNQSALGSWNLGECPQLKDDGAGADESAGDGIYSLELSLDPTALLEYKILPQGTWAGALGQQGSCDTELATRRATTPPMFASPWPLVSSAARFYLDTRTLSDPSDDSAGQPLDRRLADVPLAAR